eukprot:m.263561 g.263561  ORF g.263561 m.263561 type:complete len:116 (-) comp16010_c0_seq18:175-522(-)
MDGEYPPQFDSELPHEVLGIAQDADLATIKAAFKKLSLEWHPDKNPNAPPRVWLNIKRAFDTMRAGTCGADEPQELVGGYAPREPDISVGQHFYNATSNSWLSDVAPIVDALLGA